MYHVYDFHNKYIPNDSGGHVDIIYENCNYFISNFQFQ